MASQCAKLALPKRIFLCLAVACFYPSFNAPSQPAAKKTIIIGATSGIGEALAKELAKRGYCVGITGRRKERLSAVQQEIPVPTFARVMDVAKPEQAQAVLKELIDEMNGLDLIIINAGVGNCNLDWQSQHEIINTNVVGFSAIAALSTEYFLQQNHGHIVGISSIAALRGGASAPVYAASKAFVSHYLEGIRARFKRLNAPILVTTIEPGLVDTAMGQASDFWRASPEEAAGQIADAITKKGEHAYITKRWRIIAWLIKLCPEWLFCKLF